MLLRMMMTLLGTRSHSPYKNISFGLPSSSLASSLSSPLTLVHLPQQPLSSWVLFHHQHITTNQYHTCTHILDNKKSSRKQSKFKSLLLKDERNVSPLDSQLVKTHIKNYKKIQKQQLKIQEKESKKKQRQDQFDKQLSRLGLKKDQLQLGKLTSEDYEYLMKHQVKDLNHQMHSSEHSLTLSSLIGNKLKDQSSLERKHYRFSVIVKRTLDQILNDRSINKDERLRTQIRITNVHIGNDQRTIYIKWMRLKGYLNAQVDSNAVSMKDDLDEWLEKSIHINNNNNNTGGGGGGGSGSNGSMSSGSSSHGSMSSGSNGGIGSMSSSNSNGIEIQDSPEIYHLEKLNHLLSQASGFLTSHLSQALGLKYAPKLVFSPIVTNVQELEFAPPSIQQKYESILELKRTYELVNGCACDPMQLVVEQLECDEFMADQPINKKRNVLNNSSHQKKRRRRPLSPFTF
ncbi:hypothetical protein C9374_005748 [Naegleria lovaniensis]|uniref:Uncharacterized protein n=1 Tax=Naegleria lovaniensis TaxID=51637 RepID=A0AA88GMK8_NAELO|nr:uncharacterized protein C9374_005748 [Naegleria lovaniensis]KAG2381956.1 hypothetical protein C9374_005748 [Naegleria lovaniensis]